MTIDEKIRELKSDIVQMNAVQTVVENLTRRNNEEGEGGCMLSAISVLLREAISRYEEEIETLEGPEAA
jgi:hypothetical protein